MSHQEKEFQTTVDMHHADREGSVMLFSLTVRYLHASLSLVGDSFLMASRESKKIEKWSVNEHG